MTPSDLAARAAFAQELARTAGALATRYFRREIEFEAECKGPQDWVSAADRAVEAHIRAALARAFPGDAMLGEESGGALGDRLWVVDPIDGTLNFVHGVRYWCVSLAFVADGVREIGVIHDPSLDELFWARRGEGAWCGTQRLSVSACAALDRALVAAGYVPRHPLAAHLATRAALFAAGAAVKDMGAGALMLAHVAAGRYDAFLEPHMHPWDALAGLTLIEEAGGRVLPYPGPGGLAAGGRVIAAAPGLYAALAALPA
ncbi:MAG: inositol monophosphatase [Betaproteobacteria bacterium]|nr:inositol monophosphatase [Betaproteobacteria bacterium]MBK7589919.1 inositol monophosphatase [Betaproteobacteria bacterium]MBK7743527.1 inositol monophosphatase [Betaproteobacteria bacterium]MBK8687086.1 inositol monophosphatase [Betaproteobacteria bacterium]MBL0290446.1 inositol monophosphatase [Betaproteobacteria bacterium]